MSILQDNILQVSTLLQQYSSRYNVHLPSYSLLLFGIQSAGKSRFLNVLAGRALGTMEASAGTLHPITYCFKRVDSADQERCSILWKGVERNVETHRLLDELSQISRDIKNTTRYTLEQLVVKVELTTTVTISITDLPGLVPHGATNATEDNKTIKRMWQTFSQMPFTLPVIVTQLYADRAKMDGEIETVRAGIGRSSESLQRAIVIVSRLDVELRSQRCAATMNLMLDILREKKVSSKDRVVFLSLKPELFDPTVDDHADSRNATELNEYFATFPVVEAQMIAQHVARRLTAPDLNVGFAKAARVMSDIISNNMRANIDLIVNALSKQFNTIKDRMREQSVLVDPPRIRTDAETFINVLCASLATVAQCDPDHLRRALAIAAHDDEALPAPEVTLPINEALSFDDELKRFDMEKSALGLAYKNHKARLADRTIPTKPNDTFGALEVHLKRKLFGSSALLRLLRIWTFLVLKNTTDNVAGAELRRMASLSDSGGVQQFNVEECVRKIMQRNQSFVQRTLEDVRRWAQEIFQRHAELSVMAASRYSSYLNNVPRLKTEICDMFIDHFQKLVSEHIARAVQTVADAANVQYGVLSLSAPFSMLRLLCSTNISENLVGKKSMESQKLLQWASEDRDHSLSPFAVFAAHSGNMGPNEGSFNYAHRALCACGDMREEVTPEDFVLETGSIEFRRVSDVNVGEDADYLNNVVRVLVYLMKGLMMIKAMNAFDGHVEQPMKVVHEALRVRLNRVMQMTTDDHMLGMGTEDVAKRLTHVNDLLEEAKTNFEAQTEVKRLANQLHGCCVAVGTASFDYNSVVNELQLLQGNLSRAVIRSHVHGVVRAPTLRTIVKSLETQPAVAKVDDEHLKAMLSQFISRRASVRLFDEEAARLGAQLALLNDSIERADNDIELASVGLR